MTDAAHATAFPAHNVLPLLAFTLDISRVQRLSPTFVRLTLTGPDLAHFGTGGHPLDMRIKVVIPGTVNHFAHLQPDSLLDPADLEGTGAEWYKTWLAHPEDERGWMRTYTVRELRSAGHPGNLTEHPELDIDFVAHPGGKAADWALAAQVGDQLTLIGPNRHLAAPGYGGIEFHPGRARRILLAGDETAAPAICSILEALPESFTGTAFVEVPTASDALPTITKSRVSLTWLPRDEQPHGATAPLGSLLDGAVRSVVAPPPLIDRGTEPDDVDIDTQILWETSPGTETAFYAWLAGEAGVIKQMRRYLVRDVGVDRTQVSFMGYWREGRAEG